MAVLKRKARIVTYRVSGEEYDVLARSCLRSGARSLAEFSRTAIFDKVAALSAPSLGLNRDLSTLGKALAELNCALREASSRINRLLGPVDTGPARDQPVWVATARDPSEPEASEASAVPYTQEKD